MFPQLKLINKTITAVLTILILFSCNNKSAKEPSTKSPPEKIYLSDLVAINQIDSVLMNNNYGRHLIESAKLEEFKLKLGNSILEGGAFKMGGIGFSVYINGKKHHFTGRTHGDLIETTADIVTKNKSWIDETWIYFKTSEMNLDNY